MIQNELTGSQQTAIITKRTRCHLRSTLLYLNLPNVYPRFPTFDLSSEKKVWPHCMVRVRGGGGCARSAGRQNRPWIDWLGKSRTGSYRLRCGERWKLKGRIGLRGSGERGIGDTPRPPDFINKGSQLFIGRKVRAHEGKNAPGVAHSFGDGSHGYAVSGVTADSAEPGYGYNHRVHESPTWC